MCGFLLLPLLGLRSQPLIFHFQVCAGQAHTLLHIGNQLAHQFFRQFHIRKQLVKFLDFPLCTFLLFIGFRCLGGFFLGRRLLLLLGKVLNLSFQAQIPKLCTGFRVGHSLAAVYAQLNTFQHLFQRNAGGFRCLFQQLHMGPVLVQLRLQSRLFLLCSFQLAFYPVVVHALLNPCGSILVADLPCLLIDLDHELLFGNSVVTPLLFFCAAFFRFGTLCTFFGIAALRVFLSFLRILCAAVFGRLVCGFPGGFCFCGVFRGVGLVAVCTFKCTEEVFKAGLDDFVHC